MSTSKRIEEPPAAMPTLARAAATIALATILASGCASTVEDRAAPREVSLAEFAATDRPAVEPGTETGTGTGNGAAPVEPAGPFTLGAANEPVEPAVLASAAGVWPSTAMPVRGGTSAIVVDSLIGQVNGRPIFADEFFAPIEDELVALSRQLDEREFAFKAHELVQANLQQVVLNELFLAEAESGLSPEQQIGVFHWLRQFRERLVSSQGGTVAQTEEQMQAKEGISLEEYIDESKRRALVELLDEKIEPRVIVSWRDIEREYERRYEQFNPPAVVTLARLRLATEGEAERIAEVEERLASGEPFQAIAESLDQWRDGQWQQFEVGTEGLGAIELNEVARQRLSGLEVGQTTPAFQIGSSTWWLHVTALEQPPQLGLYDPLVQRRLAADIYRRRSAEERNRYIESLFDKGIYDELNDMSQRLLIVALLRYGPR